MRDPYHCTECRCPHDKGNHLPLALIYFDKYGGCISASDWRTMHTDEQDLSEPAWEDFARNLIFYQDTFPMLFKVFHNCGHVTTESSQQPLRYCKDCRERRANERYDW